MNNRPEIIDIDEAMERVLGHNEMYLRWLDNFFTAETIAAVRSGYESRDYATAHSAVHKLKGTAANLAILTLSETARRLDDMLKSFSPYDEMAATYEKLLADYNEAESYYGEARSFIEEYQM